LKVEELAALVAGARMAAAALAGQSAEQAAALDRVLVSFDRAVANLGRSPTRPAEERTGINLLPRSATVGRRDGSPPAMAGRFITPSED
jgi:hypothetical protein